jgi:hypothetical protein
VYEPRAKLGLQPPREDGCSSSRVHSDTDRLRDFLAFGVVALPPSEVNLIHLCVMGDMINPVDR